MFFAVNFIKNEDGVATSYSIIPYKKYLIDLKNKGFKPDLWGFKTSALAETTANSLVGTPLEQSLPPVMDALKTGKISQPAPAVVDESVAAESDQSDADSGLDEVPATQD